MADLPESPVWDDGIYQLEDTDAMKGGPPNIATLAGVDNVPHQQLARRTRWLRDQIEDIDIDGTTAERGLLRLATASEAQAGTNTAKALTPQAAASTFLRRDLGAASALTSGNNLNSVTVPGLYFWQTSNPVNRPAGVQNAKLIVETVGADIVQMVWGGSDGTIHTRRRTAGSWSAWNRMWSDGDAPVVMRAIGRQTFPNGLLMQWGTVSYADIAGQLTVPMSFPTSFPGGIFTVLATADTPQFGVTVSIRDTTTSGLNFVLREHNTEVTGGVIRWLAIGN